MRSIAGGVGTPPVGKYSLFEGDADIPLEEGDRVPPRKETDMTEVTWFEGILGHEAIKRGLARALRTGRLHHALLFTGTGGIGKAMLARALAQVALCEQSSTEGEFARCGRCSACMRIASGNHPDVIEISEPTPNLKIETIRNLQSRLAFAPFEARKRFILLHDAHKMQEAAANCLLKTLEEPDPSTTFILMTSQIQRLLPTIVSRCQTVRFAPFPSEQIAQFLQTRGLSPMQAQQIAALSSGSIGTALELSEGDDKDKVLRAFEGILGLTTAADAFSLAETIKEDKLLFDAILLMLLTYIRDIARLKSGCETVSLAHYLPSMQARLPWVTMSNLMRAMALIDDVRAAFLGNANALLGWERVLLGMYGVIYAR